MSIRLVLSERSRNVNGSRFRREGKKGDEGRCREEDGGAENEGDDEEARGRGTRAMDVFTLYPLFF